MSSAGQRARRLAAELVIVVFGVLIALWADGLAAERSDRRSLNVHLDAVGAELRQVSSGLDEHVEMLETQLELLDWLAAHGAGDVSGDADELQRAVGQGLLNPVTFEPTLGALATLENSGLMPMIRNVELRTSLSGLRDGLRFLATTETVNITGPAQRLFDPWVLDELPFVWRQMARYGGLTGGPDEPLRNADWSPLRSDRGQAIVAMQYDLVASILRDWRQFAIHLDTATGLIEHELGGG